MENRNRLPDAVPEVRGTFRHYLRTGRRVAPCIEGVQTFSGTKFNPYHDPADGRFTFAPGGSRPSGSGQTRPEFVQYRPRVGTGRGSNIRPFQDPMTLQQIFPGLHSAPGGAILGVADTMLDVTGPSSRLTTALSLAESNRLINQIRALDPTYNFDSLGFPATMDGQLRQINELRMDRATTLYKVRGDAQAFQVETLRFLQRSVDVAYADALFAMKAGKLSVRLSPQEAIGNFIDRAARRDLTRNLSNHGISHGPGQRVRVIGREYQTSGSDRTYRVPDARIETVAFDVSLTRKTLSTPQIRGFFSGDFKPEAVIVVRPAALGPNSSYIIKRPRN